jgi:formylglycine-generating enzyme required for sulfatase activity
MYRIALLPLLVMSAAEPAATNSSEKAESPDMVVIAAGSFFQGRENGRKDEAPRHEVWVDAFAIDATLVTVEAFTRFVEETHYRTSAEKMGFGMVSREGMKDWAWDKVLGANFRVPFGASQAKELPTHPDDPVVMVSWTDAAAYCRHYGKRLPTEAEWEYAMRAGKSDTRFPWGDSPLRDDGKYGLNFWQGESHNKNELADGYRYFSPVKAFPPNAWGIYDPVGNVWQWVADYYSPDAYQEAVDAANAANSAAAPDAGISISDGGSSSKVVVRNPRGPKTGTKRVARGGSWWCSPTTCSAFGLFYRGKTKPEAPFNNNGFRCAADLPPSTTTPMPNSTPTSK